MNQKRFHRHKLRMRFIRVFKHLFYELHQTYVCPTENRYKNNEWKKSATFKEIEMKARRLIGYSPNTNRVDIVWSMYLHYKEMYVKQ